MSLYLGKEKIQNISVGVQAVGVDVTGLNSETTTSFNGIIKGENGKATTAVPGTDYLTPDALNNLGSLASKSKVSESDLDDALKQTIQKAGNIQLPEGIVQNNIVNTFTADGKITMAEGYTPTNDGDIANKKWVEQQVKSAVPAFSNGPILFEESGTFNPANYNLAVGDQIQVICIGGGGAAGSPGTVAGAGGGEGDYGCPGTGITKTYEWNDGTSRCYYSGGRGGSGYLVKKIITLENISSITITIGQGANNLNGAGGSTSFGSYVIAEGGKGGGDTTFRSSSSHTEDRTYSGTIGAGGTGTINGWHVESYITQNEIGSLKKGSGAVFIWY